MNIDRLAWQNDWVTEITGSGATRQKANPHDSVRHILDWKRANNAITSLNSSKIKNRHGAFDQLGSFGLLFGPMIYHKRAAV